MTQKNNTRSQFIRYIAVGAMNTIVTLVVIYLCKTFTEIPLMVCNAIGYVAGLVNSFLWNRAWVFRATDGHGLWQALRFAIGFGGCYGVQFLVVWGLMKWASFAAILWHIGPFELSGYGIATLLGMGVYTVANFIYNRLITFR